MCVSVNVHLSFSPKRSSTSSYSRSLMSLMNPCPCPRRCVCRYGLTDIQEYYANTGALKKAAENNSSGRKVGKAISRSILLRGREMKAEKAENGSCNVRYMIMRHCYILHCALLNFSI